MRKTLVAIAALSICGRNVATGASAEWPDRPVRIIAPFAAGGTSDVLGRLIAELSHQGPCTSRSTSTTAPAPPA